MITSYKKLPLVLLSAFLFGAAFFASYVSAAPICGAPMWDYSYTGELAKLGGPSKIEVDYSGNIYVADFNSNAIRIFNSKGEAVNVIPVSKPRGVAVGQSGQIYVAQTTFASVITLDENGKVAASRVLGANYFAFANDIAVDQITGRVFIVDSVYKRVFVFGSDDSYITYFAKDKYGSKEWVALDIDQENGLIYLTSQGNNRIEVYRLSDYGIVKTLLRPFGTSSDSEFSMLQGISVDSAGRFFAVDGSLDTIDFFDGCYAFLSNIGSHGYDGGAFNLPIDVATDSFGRIYVSNIDGRISIFRSADMVAPVALSPINNALLTSNNFSLVVANGTIKPYESATLADKLFYEFQIATDEKFTNTIVTSPLVNEDPLGSTSWDASGLIESGIYFWRARAFDGSAYGPWSLTEGFKVELPNASPIINIDSVTPASATPSIIVGNSLAFSVSAYDPENDILTYTWSIDGVEVAYTQNYDYMPLTEDIGAHAVVVIVSDGINEVLWTWNVTVEKIDTVPVAPSADRPIGGEDVVTLAPELSVNNSYDAESDKLHYYFEVSDTQDFSSVVAAVNVAEGTNTTVATIGQGSLTDNTLYYWRARSCETLYENMCSSYSAVESFFVNTVNDAPVKPGIVLPADSTQVSSTAPLLKVTTTTDVDMNDILTYDFEIASDPGFANVVRQVAGLGAVDGKDMVALLWDGTPLNDNQFYYWRVRAIDNHGLDSGWVEASFFVNTANDAPSVPVLLSPSQNSEVESQTVTLVTNNSSDADMDTLIYIFQVDMAGDFISPLVQSVNIGEGVDVTSWVIPVTLEENTVYYWRVLVSDGLVTTISDNSSFFVNRINEAPSLPLLRTPLSAEKVKSDMPNLSVYPSSDPDGDGVKYLYQVSDNADFGYVVAQSQMEGGAWIVSTPLNENINYYWRAVAIDEHDMYSDWSELGQFMVNVINEAPSAPVISNQMFGFTEIVKLVIVNSSDPEGDTLTYNVEIYSDRNLTTKVDFADSIIEEESSTIWTPTIKLQNGVYYWRARAHDGQTYGSWSGTRELHVDKAHGNSNPRTDKAYGRKRF